MTQLLWDKESCEIVKFLLTTPSTDNIIAAVQEHDPKLVESWQVLADSDKTPESIGDLIGRVSGNPDWGKLTERAVRYLRDQGTSNEESQGRAKCKRCQTQIVGTAKRICLASGAHVYCESCAEKGMANLERFMDKLYLPDAEFEVWLQGD